MNLESRKLPPLFGPIPCALLLAALAVRLARIGNGLPDFLEEAIPLRLALNLRDATTGHFDLNPHTFNYPSLTIYLHFLVQQIVYALGHALGFYRTYADYRVLFDLDPSPMVLAARGLSTLADVVAILGIIRLGNRLAPHVGHLAGALATFAPLLITTASQIFCDSIMVAFVIWALDSLLSWTAEGTPRALTRYAVLSGLAIGSKYPAIVLLLPGAYAFWAKLGVRALRPLLHTAALALLVFLATTPYALLDFQAFGRDLLFERRHATDGHFGSLQHQSALFHVSQLAANLGWLPLALAAFSLVYLARDGHRRLPLATVWLALVGFGLPIAVARIDAARYLIPALYCTVALAAFTSVVLLRAWAPRHKALLAPALLFVIATPLLGTVTLLRQQPRTTQLAARAWCEAHLPDSALVVLEGYSARLPTVLQKQRYRSDATYRSASPRVQSRFEAVRAFHCVSLPLNVAGTVMTRIQTIDQGRHDVPFLDHSSALNQIFYSPHLYVGCDYFMTSSAVRGRFEADTLRYPVECAFYRWLDSACLIVARFAPTSRVEGPLITVYDIAAAAARLTPQARHDPYWWSAVAPKQTAAIAAAWSSHVSSPAACDIGLPPLPITTQLLRSVFDQYVASFVLELATEHALLAHHELAQQMASMAAAADPQNAEAWLMLCVGGAQRGAWRDVLTASSCALSAGTAHPGLQLLHARALANTGSTAAARTELTKLTSTLGPSDPIGAAARQTLATLAYNVSPPTR